MDLGGATGIGVAGAGGAITTGGATAYTNTSSGAGGSTVTVGGGTFATGGRNIAQPTGGATSGGQQTGGASNKTGGSPATGGTMPATGGTPTKGGTASTGGTSAKGGTSAVTGGTSAKGGTPSTGGTSAKGGATSAGGVSATGGTTGSGGSTCAFPTTFKWKDAGGALAQPKPPSGQTWASLKDFTVTKSGSQYVVYGSVYNTTTSAYGGFMLTTSDLTQMGSATQNAMSRGSVAPTLVYFTPKSTWVLLYQWGFQYATSSDPTNPSSWSGGKTLLTGGPSGALDQTFICDSTTCYLFFAGDDGNIYRSSMPIGSFPGTFSGYTTIMTDTKSNLFEAVQVYTVKGTGKYLMIVEAMGAGGRYFRGFSATSLGGTWTAISGASTEATPFAGKNNVTFTGSAWTSDISHGDLVRDDPAETQTVDPCNMRLLYQGRSGTTSDYNALPYRPGLLTKTN